MLDINQTAFVQLYQEKFGQLAASADSGLQSILASMNQDEALDNLRWAAYMLATVKHECADQWRPLEEYGKGVGRPYGNAVTVTDENGRVYANRYYGRGYVQLTWEQNYDKLGQALGLGKQLLYHPDLALRADIAYRILSFGMRNGSFTGRKLGQFLHDGDADYFNARQIINGHDKAALIEGYARGFETLLQTSARA